MRTNLGNHRARKVFAESHWSRREFHGAPRSRDSHAVVGRACTCVAVGRRSVLDLCLIVVMFAFLFEVVRVALGTYARFSLGFYAVRIYSLVTATAVLLVLLSGTTTLYANLARSI